jgi:DNA-binding transcriptional LysR family regulator
MAGDQQKTQWRLTPTGATSSAQTVPVPIAGRFVAGSMSMVRELTLLGVGIGAIDVQLARRHVEEGKLLRVLPDWALPEVAVHFVTPSRLMPARVRLFADWLASRFADTKVKQPTTPRR